MSGPRVQEVDVSELAAQGASLERHFPLKGFARLISAIAPGSQADNRDVTARFRFGREQGKSIATVEVDARLPLICQRCLQPVELPVTSSTRLVFVDHSGEPDPLASEREPFETRGGLLALADVVEEELLLALPLVPAHDEENACEAFVPDFDGTEEVASAERAQLPFAALKDLLGRK